MVVVSIALMVIFPFLIKLLWYAGTNCPIKINKNERGVKEEKSKEAAYRLLFYPVFVSVGLDA